MRLITLIAGAALIALAGCGGNEPVADEAENADALPSINRPAPSADGAPPANAAAAAPGDGATPAAAIPAALHGRWGLTPADCTSQRGDAKGLLVVRADGLQFYESRAVPAGNVQTSSNSIGADFSFTGEGQAWTKFQTLTVNKDKLVRTESSPMASFTYARCG
jgi:hypothetical protein